MAKTRFLIASLLALAFSAPAFARCITTDAWTGPDKVKHFGMGFAASSAATVYFKRADYGFWTGVAVGAAKELYDASSRGHVCSLQDFAVTGLGAAAGAGLTGWVVLPRLGRTEQGARDNGVVVGWVGRF